MTKPNVKKKPIKNSFTPLMIWLGAFLLIIVSCFYFAWKTLAIVDFLYPVWYQHIQIDQAIERFGPQNRYKNHFADTTEEERFRLFNAILKAVQNDGKDLAQITYHYPNGKPIDTLLTPAEVIHLQDVAHLISVFHWTGLISTIILIPGISLLIKKKIPIPRLHTLLGATTLIFIITGIITLVIGPVKVFYFLHTLVFPENHQWFFYYQESLMSTLMLAPTLFGYIALAWALLSFIFITLFLQTCHYYTHNK